jgi:uncharacterized protein YutE (UPF0331/DUF86 family)
VPSDIVIRKLESLARCLSRIESHLPDNEDDLAEDLDSQDIISVNLERAVQSAIDIAAHLVSTRPDAAVPETRAELFDLLRRSGQLTPETADTMKQAVGLRNLAVHDYSALDWKRLHGFLPKAMGDLKRFASEVFSLE